MLQHAGAHSARYNQGGKVSVSAGQTSATNNLPISWNKFLQGTVSWDNPGSTSEVTSVAVNCTTTSVTVGCHSSVGSGYTGLRYVVFGI